MGRTYRLRRRKETVAYEFGGYVRVVEEARAVLERLARIEALDRAEAPARTVLAEVRELLGEAEAWLKTERDGTEPATDLLERLRLAVDRGAAEA
jgi:hypothetical protein